MLIETLPAAFEMDEILWELRQHSAGLNCGRWDYNLLLHQDAARGPRRRHARPVRCAGGLGLGRLRPWGSP